MLTSTSCTSCPHRRRPARRTVRCGFGWRRARGSWWRPLRTHSGATAGSRQAVAQGGDGDPDQPVAAARDVVGVAGEIGDQVVAGSGVGAGEPAAYDGAGGGLGDRDEGLVGGQGDAVGEGETLQDHLHAAVGVEPQEPPGPGVLDDVVLPALDAVERRGSRRTTRCRHRRSPRCCRRPSARRPLGRSPARRRRCASSTRSRPFFASQTRRRAGRGPARGRRAGGRRCGRTWYESRRPSSGDPPERRPVTRVPREDAHPRPAPSGSWRPPRPRRRARGPGTRSMLHGEHSPAVEVGVEERRYDEDPAHRQVEPAGAVGWRRTRSGDPRGTRCRRRSGRPGRRRRARGRRSRSSGGRPGASS